MKKYDVIVIGGGPAGLAAACVVAGISSMTARTSNARNEHLFLFIN